MVNIVRKRLPDGLHGQTDGRTVYVDDRLSAAQMFCTVQHELVHIERGHATHQPDDVEMEVRFETARRCLPVEGMLGVCKRDVDLTAKRLGVTPRILMDRTVTFTDEEARLVGCDQCRACPAMRYRFAGAEAVAI